MKQLIAAAALTVALSGCASFANSPSQVQANVSAAVSDTQTVATGTVTILGDLAKAALSITAPITSILGSFGSL